MEVFEQILGLDEEDGDLFSKEIVDEYFTQAKKTFTEMDTALCVRISSVLSFRTYSLAFRKKKDLESLSSLGHFLKGSSAALGVFKVQSSCEDIQHYGHLREGIRVIKEEDALARISTTLARAREEYQFAEVWLKHFYVGYRADQGEEPSEEPAEESD